MRTSRAPTVIDLFSGAGVFGYAFERAGFSVVASYEKDATAAATNALNVKSVVQVADLAATRPIGRCDVLISGPPCQGFSSLGHRLTDDPRNNLCLLIPAWASVTKARVVVVENVPRFLKSEAWCTMTDKLAKLGFSVDAWILNAREFRVAQNRVRSISMYFKGDRPEISWPVHSSTNVEEVFAGLPSFPTKNLQHITLPPTDLMLRRFQLVPYGGDIRDIHKADPSLVPAAWLKVRDKIVDIWGRLTWEGLSNTIRTGFLDPSRGRFTHPVEDRPISFREAARLQSIPDGFIFAGRPKAMARQIGNGVPFNLGKTIAEAVLVTL
jgi:DNA (cytosine-5)-methyltransferase 1